MPRSEEVLSIFLASPSDVSDERSRLAEVIGEWNRAWSRHFGLRLELLRWEDDAYPDIGEDAQSIINEQIPADWDLFVGVMWSRFGTPTGRAGSGTQEEFDRAIDRYRAAPDSVSVLFYFKDAPIAPEQDRYGPVTEGSAFKEAARTRGLLTWDFSDTNQFEKFISLHITKHVQEWKRKALSAQTTAVTTVVGRPTTSPTSPMPAETHDDSGYIDLLEVFTERCTEIAEISNRLTAAEQALTEQSNRAREELDTLRANPVCSPKSFRNSIARVADEMLRFTDRVESEIPLFRTAIDAAMSALIRLATLTAELYPEQMESNKAAAIQLLTSLTGARQATEGFRNSTAALPRMTKELNAAKRKQVAALDSLISEFGNGERLLAEGVAVITSLR